MAINIIKQPDVHVTASDLARYRREYERSYMYYSGAPPTFEDFIRNRQREDGLLDERARRS